MPINKLESFSVNSDETLKRIVAHPSRFLSFLASRVQDKAVAEDILQSAYSQKHTQLLGEPEKAHSAEKHFRLTRSTH